MEQPLLMHINNSVFLQDHTLVMIDRRYLPWKEEKVIASNFEEVAGAIEQMVVQGAGDIAITAGYGLYLATCQAEQSPDHDLEKAQKLVLAAQQRLINTRPTGFHLAALLNKLANKIDWTEARWSDQVLQTIETIICRQQNTAELTGRWAAELLEDGDRILTHCFPGPALLYMLLMAQEQNKKVNVVCTETRPYLQGARLTAWSVAELGIPVTLITDNMAAYCMSQGMISKVFTAADRIALDGTVANKIGTFQLAIVAQYHKLPFYILGYGGPDKSCLKGEDIVIELRDPNEILMFNGAMISDEKVSGFYPAFDLTPPSLLSGIVTDRGTVSPEEVKEYWAMPIIKID